MKHNLFVYKAANAMDGTLVQLSNDPCLGWTTVVQIEFEEDSSIGDLVTSVTHH